MRRLSRVSSFVITAVAMAILAVSVPIGTVAAQSDGNGLDETSVNTFLLDAERGVLRVTVEVTLINVTRDRTEGNVINRTYFDGYYVAVPLGAVNIVATRNGQVLDGALNSDPEFPAFSFYEFPLGRQLFSGESTTVTVTYDHLGAGPRNQVPWRVNAAYAAYVAFGLGDDEQVTIRIVQPVGYDFDEFTDLEGFDVSDPDAFGLVTYTRSGLDEDFELVVGMSNDDKLESRELDVDGVDIELRSWPDDPEWAAFATERVERGIPSLEGLIGTPWPVDGDFDIRQTVEPNLYGYAGWFDEQSSEIAVGEDLDADTIYHELSHAWFNQSLTDERWLTEGLAQVYAAELVRVDGDEPRQPAEPSPTDPGFRELTGWTALDSTDEVEEFGYNASFWVLDALVDEIGIAEIADVVAALRDDTSPYATDMAGDSPDEDWQRAYDLFVEVGEARNTRALFETHVVSRTDADLIAARDDAAAEMAALAERSAPWELPAGIRSTLERWDTDDTAAGIEGADAVLALRSELESLREATHVDEPEHGESGYESAERTRNGSVDFTASIEPLESAIERGGVLGERQALVAERAAAAGVTPPPIPETVGVEDFESGIAVADDQIDVLDRIVGTADRIAAISGTTAAVGRWGVDLDAEVDAARAEVERGDYDAARELLDSTDDRIDRLDDVGTRRLLTAGLAALALVLFAVIVILLLRRRRHRRPAVGPETTAMTSRLDTAKALYLEAIRDGHAAEAIAKYSGSRYTQHSTPVKDGQAGFVEFFEDFHRRNPIRDIEIVRGFEDGRYVFLHVVQTLNNGEFNYVTADIFDTDDDGKLIEHWDMIAELVGEGPNSRRQVDGPTEPTDLDKTVENKALVTDFLRTVLRDRNHGAAADYISADTFVRHDTQHGDGLDAFVSSLADPDQTVVYEHTYNVIGSGSFVAAMSRASRSGVGIAVIDLFRVDAGRIVEHWDVVEELTPADTWVNSGKF